MRRARRPGKTIGSSWCPRAPEQLGLRLLQRRASGGDLIKIRRLPDNVRCVRSGNDRLQLHELALGPRIDPHWPPDASQQLMRPHQISLDGPLPSLYGQSPNSPTSSKGSIPIVKTEYPLFTMLYLLTMDEGRSGGPSSQVGRPKPGQSWFFSLANLHAWAWDLQLFSEGTVSCPLLDSVFPIRSWQEARRRALQGALMRGAHHAGCGCAVGGAGKSTSSLSPKPDHAPGGQAKAQKLVKTLSGSKTERPL
jgi:hypothetical protein